MDIKIKTEKLTNIDLLTEISKKLGSINNHLTKIESRLDAEGNNDIDKLSFTELYSLREVTRNIFTDNNHHEGNAELVSQSRMLINKLNSKIEYHIKKYNEDN